MTRVEKVWDRFAIKAALGRKGLTLTGVAEEAGLDPAACRKGLSGMSRPGAQAVADALEEPFSELFPGLYLNRRRDKNKHNQKSARRDSAKISSAVDKRAGAA